jgi:hypothetical protein
MAGVDRHLQRDPPADALARDVDGVELQVVEHVEIEDREVGDVINVAAGVGGAEAWMVGRDDLEMSREFVKARLVLGDPLGAMQEEQWRALAHPPDVYFSAMDINDGMFGHAVLPGAGAPF